jgi:hypothetical protein
MAKNRIGASVTPAFTVTYLRGERRSAGLAAKEPLMILDYLALGILIFVALTFVYGLIAIHDIP